MMSRTKIFALFMAMCLLAASVPNGQAADCSAAVKSLTDSGAGNDFKSCASAAGSGKIPLDCCVKLAPFLQYQSCLSDPQYSGQAAAFLAPVLVSKASSDCMSAVSG